MNMKSINPGKTLKVLRLALSLAALPLFLGVTGCTTSGRTDHSAGQQIDDRATTARVKEALSADPIYKFGAVNVETFRSTVQLSGFVPSPEQKSRAGDIAGNITGVREVVNNITVKQSAN
jgi:hyperosmotically inducible periplasmic protein